MAVHTPMSPPPTTTTSFTVLVEAVVAAVEEVARPRAAPPLTWVLAVTLAAVRATPRSAQART
jgi:hypothetical protein